MAEWTLSVSQLNEYVRRQLAGDPMLRSVRVEGEISGFKHHVSGHKYFTLKDDKARVQCVMFRQNALSLDFSPKEGMKVVATGSASLFVRDGAYQLYVESMREAGAGDLYREFERRKKKLADEGLFDPALKRPLPAFPRAIGVVTAPGGAAFWDIVRVCQARNPHVGIVLSPCAVQGDGAAEDIARAIARLNARGRVARGARRRLDRRFVGLQRRSGRAGHSRFSHSRDFLRGARDRFYDCGFCRRCACGHAVQCGGIGGSRVCRASARGDALGERLASGLKARLALSRARLLALGASAALTMPGKLILEGRKNRLETLWQREQAAMQQRLNAAQRTLALAKRSLDALNPMSVLRRGFAVVEKADGALVTEAKSLREGEGIAVLLHDGRLRAHVDAVEEKPEETQADCAP